MLWSLPFYLQLQHYIKLLVCTEPVVGIEFPLNIYLLAWFWLALGLFMPCLALEAIEVHPELEY
jgi:hypothetical protein